MFRRILTVADNSPTGLAAASFAAEMAREFGADASLLHVAESRSRHFDRATHMLGVRGHKVVDLDVDGISELTTVAHDHHLASSIAGEAARFGADVVVLGLERRKAHRYHSRALQRQVAKVTSLPVMVAPATECELQRR